MGVYDQELGTEGGAIFTIAHSHWDAYPHAQIMDETQRSVHYGRVVGDKDDNMRFTVRRFHSVPVSCEEDDDGMQHGDTSVVEERPCVSCRDFQEVYGPADRDGNCADDDTPKTSPLHNVESRTSLTIGVDSHLGTKQQALLDPVANRGRLFAKRQRQRLVFKEGECNISNTKVSDKKRKYLLDIFTTVMEMKWRYNLLLFGLGFIMSWLLFAFLWWLVAYLHKDHLHQDDADWLPCMSNVYDFKTALLFSVETQHTIGYGFRAAEPNCPETVILLMAQSVFGVFIQSLMTGIIFAKLSRPKRRAATLMFSKTAVICQRDGELVLLFRVADMRKSHIVGTVIRAVLVRNKMTKEGELIPLFQFPLALETETARPEQDSYVFLAWPVTVTHHINKDSPLWELSADQLLSEHFEIIVIFEGTVESTGMTTQVRTSYLPSEILWGHRLAPLMTFQKENGQYKIDYTLFHNTIPVDTPEVSGKDLAERNQDSEAEPEYVYPANFTCPPRTPLYPPPSVFKRVRASFKRRMSENLITNRRRRKSRTNLDAADSVSGSLSGSMLEMGTVKSLCEKKDSADSGFGAGTPIANHCLKEDPLAAC